MKLKAYIATRFEDRGKVYRLERNLRDSPFEVISTWHLRNRRKKFDPTQEAQIDLQELSDASVLLVLAVKKKVRGGYLFESGFAHARGKPIYLIGESEVVFFKLIPRKRRFRSVKEFVRFAKASGSQAPAGELLHLMRRSPADA